ncbi:hypothetical protein BJ875DRAFT_163344 [Amylocarpus encephaloides]|uniref:Uncharacterized protein n=1 Tax=Amylocarpus encephaloides TaxID=45428 RepID=A0A9P8C197_9HELO|nr:hypothetical protein BJ875DRAFT_163344 [Amylocarpus encephaloides]
MAAVEFLNYADRRLENEYAQQTTRPWTIGWDEEDTRIRLSLLARAWVELRSASSSTKLNAYPNREYTWRCRRDREPLKIPVPGSKCHPECSEAPKRTDEVTNFHDTEARAEKHPSTLTDFPLPASRTPPRERNPSLFYDPTMAPAIDFQSDDGFKQMKGKKKKGGAAKANNWEDNEEKKKEEGEGEGEGNNGGDKDSGDIGAGAGDNDGAKKDDANGDGTGDAPPEDDWGSFVPAKSKKKGKKGKQADESTLVAAPDPPAEKFDAFHEIKLDDGPGLDLSFDSGFAVAKSSTSGVSTWGSNWKTGDSKATTTTAR